MSASKRVVRGFSLIEVALSAAILLSGLAGLASALPELSHVQEHQRHLADAATVAGNVLEDAIHAQDAGTLGAGVVTVLYDAKGNPSATGPFTATRTVVLRTPIPEGRSIEVVVTWDEWGRQKSFSLKTYAYKP